MENDGIRGGPIGDFKNENTSASENKGLLTNKDCLSLPSKVRNNIHFNIIRPKEVEKPKQEVEQVVHFPQEEQKPFKTNIWPEQAQSGQTPPQLSNTDEMSKQNQSKINPDSLTNAFCNENNIIKMDQIQVQKKQKQPQPGFGGSNDPIIEESK